MFIKGIHSAFVNGVLNDYMHLSFIYLRSVVVDLTRSILQRISCVHAYCVRFSFFFISLVFFLQSGFFFRIYFPKALLIIIILTEV